MELFIVESLRYVIVLLFAVYTFYCFFGLRYTNPEKQNGVYTTQQVFTVLLHLVMSVILIMENKSIKYIIIWIIGLLFYFVFLFLYQVCYKGLSRLVFNNMMMCMMVGFVMLARLSYDYALHQIIMASIALGICIFVPVIIEKLKILEKMGWQYAMVGIAFLMLVFIIGVEKYGSRNWISFGGIAIQPSEFVKIIFVFFIASLLSRKLSLKKIAIVSGVAAVHVIILVLEKDLGAALIYFFTYIMVLYVATTRIAYVFLGAIGGTGAALVAYRLFSHVRNRVIAWQDPFGHITTSGYQVSQSLFAIGTGGFIGLGLGKGLPTSVPVVESDFIFAAISEELGGAFAICLLLVYLSSFIMFMNIAMKMKNRFHKLTAFGLSVIFIVQVFICVGGVTKFIPSTGVTLPLISYGGSSIMSTIALFSIIQGMYVINSKGEGDKYEEK
ncbi:FtsW/RodA/SpoVE family cell cycle protein [Eubacterium xylanophilum]|uniref:FtsW/RodA/SpoVE family cell cycle protein n=1 Tax=Eubacterium xylanophilum TaxID=39497 RepID=UPI00047C915A|nr:FtsW/RodA/SpoVE family cell cycle protein [Eubacterium xylanophilum]